MASGVEITGLGLITYYALAVYFLFFIGIILTCRRKFTRAPVSSTKKTELIDETRAVRETREEVGLRKRANVSPENYNGSEIDKEGMGGYSSKAGDATGATLTFKKSSEDVVLNGGIPGKFVGSSLDSNKNDVPERSHTDQKEVCLEADEKAEIVDQVEYVTVEEHTISEKLPCGTVITTTTLSQVDLNKAEDAATADQIPKPASEEKPVQLSSETVNDVVKPSDTSFDRKVDIDSDVHSSGSLPAENEQSLQDGLNKVPSVDSATQSSLVSEPKSETSISSSDYAVADEISSGILNKVHGDSKPSIEDQEPATSITCLQVGFPDEKVSVYENYADRILEEIFLTAFLESAKEANIARQKYIDSEQVVDDRSELQFHSDVERAPSSMLKDEAIPYTLLDLATEQSHAIVEAAMELLAGLLRKRSSVELYASSLSDSVIESSIIKSESCPADPCNRRKSVENIVDSMSDSIMADVTQEVNKGKPDCVESSLAAEERTSVDSGIDDSAGESSSHKKELTTEIDGGHQSVSRTSSSNGNIQLSGFAENLVNLLAEEEDDLDFIESDEDLDKSLDKIKTTYGERQRRISVEVDRIKRQCSVDEINNVSPSSLKRTVVRRRTKTKLKGDRPLSLFAQDMLEDFLDDDMFLDDMDESFADEEKITSIQAKVDLLESKLDIIPPVPSVGDEYEYVIDEVMRTSVSSSSLPRSLSSRSYSQRLKTPAVIDFGCGTTKAGMAGESAPQCYCPSVIGVPRRFSQDVSKMTKAYYVGEDAWALAGMLQINHPIKPNITSWADVASLLEYFLEYELLVNDNEHPVLLTELGQVSKRQREKLTEIAFERFGVPGFYLANQGSLAMNSMGLHTGICLNVGFSCTQAIPLYESCAIDHAVTTVDVGGNQVTDYLGRLLLGNQGLGFSSSSEKLVLNQMKEQLAYISQDPMHEQEMYKKNSSLHELYTMPDGQSIEVGTERFIAGEILFDPKLLGLQQPNIAELIYQCLDRLDVDLHEEMTSNVLVTGGASRLPGFGQRLEKELELVADGRRSVKVKYADNPSLAPWIGGSVLCSIPSFEEQWMSIDSYAEAGAQLVHKVCF